MGWGKGIGLKKTDWGLFGSDCEEVVRELAGSDRFIQLRFELRKKHTLSIVRRKSYFQRGINFDRTKIGSLPFFPASLPLPPYPVGLVPSKGPWQVIPGPQKP